MGKPLKKLTIDRTKWARSSLVENKRCAPHGRSALRNEKGCMCCLGFDCLMNGATPAQIQDGTFPHRGNLKSSLTICDQHTAALINDRCQCYGHLTNEEQEQEIAMVFRRNGVEVEFIN